MKDKKKALRIVLLGLYFIACAAFPVLTSWLPRKYGVEWIIGWPEFLGNMLGYAPIFISCWFWPASHLFKPKRVPEQTPEQTKKQKKNAIVSSAVLCAIFLWLSIGLSFFNQWRKIDRYERSPNGKNKAIVMVHKDDDAWAWRTEYVCPVRAWLFYEDDNCIYLHPGSEAITFTWLDDNTLEITRTWEYDGEVKMETEQLRW